MLTTCYTRAGFGELHVYICVWMTELAENDANTSATTNPSLISPWSMRSMPSFTVYWAYVYWGVCLALITCVAMGWNSAQYAWPALSLYLSLSDIYFPRHLFPCRTTTLIPGRWNFRPIRYFCYSFPTLTYCNIVCLGVFFWSKSPKLFILNKCDHFRNLLWKYYTPLLEIRKVINAGLRIRLKETV